MAKPFFPNENVAMGVRMAKDMVFDFMPAAPPRFRSNVRTFHPRFEGQNSWSKALDLDFQRNADDGFKALDQKASRLGSHTVKLSSCLGQETAKNLFRSNLRSAVRQTYENWELQVSDDGSSDDTLKIIDEFAKHVPQRVVVRRGPQIGFWQNFVSLVRSDDINGDLFAYSDQDDVWFPEKLAKAVSWFEAQPSDEPALYFTRTELIEESGAPIGFSALFVRAPSFQNALVQNIGGGNTMVFNRAARLALRATPADVALVSHDWWTYQVVTGIGGTAYYDPWPSLRYRQHELNLVGANSGLRARLVRLSAFASGRMLMWNDINLKALGRMRAMLTPGNAVALDRLTQARHVSWPKRLSLVRASGVYRQGIVENVGLFIGALFGRL